MGRGTGQETGQWNFNLKGVCTPHPASYRRPIPRHETLSGTTEELCGNCVCSNGIELLVCEAEDQAVTETTMEKSTPEERYIVSGARIKLFTFSPQSEVKEFDEMSFADQLRYARQQP